MNGAGSADTEEEEEASTRQDELTWSEASHFPHSPSGQNPWEITGTKASLRKLVLVNPVEPVIEPEVKGDWIPESLLARLVTVTVSQHGA